MTWGRGKGVVSNEARIGLPWRPHPGPSATNLGLLPSSPCPYFHVPGFSLRVQRSSHNGFGDTVVFQLMRSPTVSHRG